MTFTLPEISAMERLRWIVCGNFGVLPGSVSLSGADWLRCGANMLLDRRQKASREIENPGFDRERFDELKGGGA